MATLTKTRKNIASPVWLLLAAVLTLAGIAAYVVQLRQGIGLTIPAKQLISRPGVRVHCAVCGEEIINERQITTDGQTLCCACAGPSYYQTPISLPVLSLQETSY